MTPRAAADTRAARLEQSARHAPGNFARGAGPGPPAPGLRAPSAGAHPRRPSSLLHVTGAARRSPTPGWRRRRSRRREQVSATAAAERPGAGGPERGARSAEPAAQRAARRGGLCVRERAAPSRKAAWPRRPARNSPGRGAGLLSQPLGDRDARTLFSKRLSLSRWGKLGRCVPLGDRAGVLAREAAPRSGAEVRPDRAPAGLRVSRGAGTGT